MKPRPVVLIVEPMFGVALELRYACLLGGLHAVVAMGRENALGLAAECRPAVVVSEAQLPDGTADQLARELKGPRGGHSIPVIAMGECDEPMPGREPEWEDCLVKPFTRAKLIERILHWCGRQDIEAPVSLRAS